MTRSTEARPPRRRQARGDQRVAQLLDAADAVFATMGYESTTTNAIAARAGASPGTLYQFFPNKEAVAQGLADRYLARIRDIYGFVSEADTAELPLLRLLDLTVDPLIVFNDAHPGFKALFAGHVAPKNLAESAFRLHAAVLEYIEHLIVARAPQLAPDAARRTAMMAVTMIKGVLPVIQAAEDRERVAIVAELKRALLGYLGPLEDHPVRPVTPSTTAAATAGSLPRR